MVAAVFCLRALVTAFAITPLWDVPDETGHFAYVDDLAHGRGIPVAGKSEIPRDVVRSWKGADAGAEANWISQHPPLYHFAAVPFLVVAERVSDLEETRFRAPRVLAALLGTVSIVWLFELVLLYTADAFIAFVVAAMLAVLPMFIHMSAGTNHDVAMALCGVAAAHYFVRLFRDGRASDLLKMSGALAAAGAIKLTALALAAPLLVIATAVLLERREARFSVIATAAFLSFSTAAAWLLRNELVSGGSLLLAPPAHAPELSLLAYFVEYPVVDHTMKNFIGLIGWTGTGNGAVRWLQIGGVAYLPYVLLLLVFAWTAIVWLALEGRRNMRLPVLVLATMTALAFTVAATNELSASDLLKNAAYGSLIALFTTLILVMQWKSLAFEARMTLSSLAIIAGFSAAYAIRIWNAYLFYGEMRATHGRYFFIVIPFIVFALIVPSYRLAQRCSPRFARAAAVAMLGILVAADVHFLVRGVLPFFSV